MATTRETKLLGVFGKPLAHTLSPKMHSFFAEKTGLDTAYLAFEIDSADKLKEIVSGAGKMGAKGFNVTAPYKVDIMDCLDEIDEEAKLMGAVNTIVNRDGKWYGYNTDGIGFLTSLVAVSGDIAGKNVLMLGAGGAARGVSYKLAKEGAASITFHARTKERAEYIGEIIKENTNSKFYAEMDKNKKYDIIINCTSLGMHPHEAENPFEEHMDMIDKTMVCCDLIYNPRKTVFLQEAEKRGAKILNGLPMFVLQGLYAYEIFCDVKLDEEFYEGAMELLSEYRI